MEKNKEISLNDLPKYSQWPARLLGIEIFENKIKNTEEINREYEYEKWGSLIKQIYKNKDLTTVEQVDKLVFKDNPENVYFIDNKFYYLHHQEAHNYYLDLIEKTISKYLPASSLIEFGAGYGSVIIPLSRRNCCSNLSIYASEYTRSGVRLIEILKASEKRKIISGHCDFNSHQLTDLDLPEGGIFFTSFSTCILPIIHKQLIDCFISYKPKVVIHFEPCYEHFTNNKLIDLMRTRYIEINDYNRNLISILREAHENNKIEILEEYPPIYGTNPFLPCSIIVWKGNF